MLSLAGIVPATPLHIPEVSGTEVTNVPETTNAYLKLAVKIHSLAPDVLIVLSAKAPILHHRFAIAEGVSLVRFFSSNIDANKVVDIRFPVAKAETAELEQLAFNEKVPTERYHQEHEVVALDDGSLSLFYYLAHVQCFPKSILLSTSDLSQDAYVHLGNAVGKFASESSQKVVVLIADHLYQISSGNTEDFLKSIRMHNYSTLLAEPESQYRDDGQTMFFSLSFLDAVMRSAFTQPPKHHFLGADSYHEEHYVVSYFDEKN